MKLAIKKTHPSAILPTRAKPGDSGLDLYACLPDGQLLIGPGGHQVVSTGVAVELPEPFLCDGNEGLVMGGFEGQVRGRSGLSLKGIICPLGTIDSGYRGDIGVTLSNQTQMSYEVRHGDRIAQLVIAPVVYPEVVEVDELTETERGVAGFGSTGV